jgi:hypothetical protein
MRKRLLMCLVLAMLVGGLAWADNTGKKRIEVLEPTAVIAIPKGQIFSFAPRGRQIDTLVYDSGSTMSGYYWAANYVMASRMSPAGPCKVLGGLIYSWSTGGATTFDCDLFDWTGAAPGAQLGTGVNTPTDGTAAWRYSDYESQDINVTGDFLVGFHMLDNVAVLGYEAANSGRCWDRTPGGAWSTWNETYFIRAVVEYEAGEPDIECDPNPLIWNTIDGLTTTFWCRNVGDAELNVTDITYAAAWIDTVYDKAFVVADSDSVEVTVGFDTVGIMPGTYYDTLWIASDDPDENPYPEAIELTVPDMYVEDGVEIKIIPVDPTVTAFPNPTTNSVSITFTLSQPTDINIGVYDALGRRVSTLINGTFKGGVHDFKWDVKNEGISQGIYFIQLETDKVEAREKVIIAK